MEAGLSENLCGVSQNLLHCDPYGTVVCAPLIRQDTGVI